MLRFSFEEASHLNVVSVCMTYPSVMRMLNLMRGQGDDTMAKFETIMLLSKELTGKSGKKYRRVADCSVDPEDTAKLKMDWKRSILAFPTKNNGFAIVRVSEE